MTEKEKIISYSYIISHNTVLFCKEDIAKEDIKKGGKYAFGENPLTGETVEILDKDYGKSSELMRALLEDDNEYKKEIKRVFWVICVIGSIILLFFITSFFGKKEEIKTDKTMQKTGSIVNIIPTPPTPTPPTPPTPTPPQTNSGIITIGSGSQENQEKQTLEILKKQIDQERQELEKQKIQMTSEVSQQNALLEINGLNSQIKELTKKNTELQAIYEKNKQELENTKIELEKMQKDNSLCNKIYNKTSRESFIYYLGGKIYDSCENKTATTEQQNYCKNLYYEYIK